MNQAKLLRSAAAMVAAGAFLVATTPASAGEVTGSGKDITINGNSLCAFSGQNDTPDGFWIEVAPGIYVQIDPGGRVQSYGYFKEENGFYPSPSDPASRDSFLFPANGCNPNSGAGGI